MIDLPDDDDELMAELGEALGAGAGAPVPGAVLAAARAAFAWRTVDEDIAALSLDSLLELSAPGMRGGSDRQLTFSSTAFTLEVDIVDGTHVVGQVVPPAAGPLQLERIDSEAWSTQVDDDGRFEAPAHAGPFRLRFHPSDGAGVVTEWVTL